MDASKLTTLLKDALANHTKRRRLIMATGGVSLLVVVWVFVSLMVPAISMEQNAPLLEADPVTTELGNKLSVRVTAAAKSDADTVFLLSSIGEGGLLASDYVPNDRGELQLETEDGSSVVIHMVDESKDAAGQVADAESAVALAVTDPAEEPLDDSQDQDGEATTNDDGTVSQSDGVDTLAVEAEKELVDEKRPTDAKNEGERKQLYWFIAPQGTTLSFSLDFESSGGGRRA